MARPYKTLCISFYEEDLTKLDAKVAELKASGYTRMSRSMLFRVAVACFEQHLLSVELQDLLEKMHGQPARVRQYGPVRRVREHTCVECGEHGHNSLTCPNGDGDGPTPTQPSLFGGAA